MAKVTVGTSPVPVSAVGRQRPVIQNLGPGILYLDEDSSVTSLTGLRLPVGAVYEVPLPSSYDGQFWMVADAANTDVRFMALGG